MGNFSSFVRFTESSSVFTLLRFDVSLVVSRFIGFFRAGDTCTLIVGKDDVSLVLSECSKVYLLNKIRVIRA